MNNQTTKSQISWYVTFLCLISVLVWLYSGNNGVANLKSIPNLMVEDKVCKTSSLSNRDQFYIFSGGQTAATLLNEVACKNEVINKQFGQVYSFWHVNDLHTLQIIGKGQANLALVKENIMTALRSEETHGYTKIASYPEYQAYFIARQEKPRLNKAYFLDKRIALLNYPTSRSGHIIPIQKLNDLGLTLDKLDIVYARSHSELRNLLHAGDVDIIASYWQKEDEQLFSDNYKVAISSPVSGSSWYLKLNNDNDDLLCASQIMLKYLSNQQNQKYYQNLTLLPFKQCQAKLMQLGLGS